MLMLLGKLVLLQNPSSSVKRRMAEGTGLLCGRMFPPVTAAALAAAAATGE